MHRFFALLRRLVVNLTCPPPPPSMTSQVLEEVIIMGLKFRLNFSAPGAADVAKRVLQLTVNGPPGSPPPTVNLHELPPTALSFEFVVERNSTVDAQLQDVDGAGNASPWYVMPTFTAVDTFPPPVPTVISVESLGEE